MIVWVLGFAATIGVIVAQLVFPFAFDFVTTLMVYGAGVYVGRVVSTKP